MHYRFVPITCGMMIGLFVGIAGCQSPRSQAPPQSLPQPQPQQQVYPQQSMQQYKSQMGGTQVTHSPAASPSSQGAREPGTSSAHSAKGDIQSRDAYSNRSSKGSKASAVYPVDSSQTSSANGESATSNRENSIDASSADGFQAPHRSRSFDSSMSQ